MVVVWNRSSMSTVRQLLGYHVDIIKRHLSLSTFPKMNDTFHLRMQRLVKPNYYILSWLPFESSLSSNDVVRIYFLSSKFFDARWFDAYPNLLPAESLVFWVEEACILDALNTILWVSCSMEKERFAMGAKKYMMIWR